MTTKVQGDMYDIDGATVATVAAGDKFNFLDITDSLVKEDTVQGVLDLVSAGFTLATEQASTSGATIDFTGIPSGTSLIIISFANVGNTGTDNFLCRIGDSGGIESSGYDSSAQADDTSGWTGTSEFVLASNGGSGGNDSSGNIILSLSNAATFHWVYTATLKHSSTRTIGAGGDKSLSAELDRVQLLLSGSETFNAGTINIMYM